MSNQNGNGGNILTAVKGEIEGARVKRVKGELKTLVEDLLKATDVVSGIQDKIVEKCEKEGLTEAEVKTILSGD